MRSLISKNNTTDATTPVSSQSEKTVQCKLTVGAPGDKYEQEADAVADKVMRMPEQNFVQRKCDHCEEEEKKQVQRKPLAENITPIIQAKSDGGVTLSNSISNKISSSQGSGSRMDSHTQSFMSSRFGSDFSQVKIHTDGEAVQMNRELNAKAFTTGNDIYFNEGQYQPNSESGKHLLAHELTHTVQQQENGSSVQAKKKPGPTNVEGGGATPGKGDGIDVVFIINSPDDAFTGDVVNYIKNTLEGQDYYIVDGLDDIFGRLNTIANGVEYHYVPIIDDMVLPPEVERMSHISIPPKKVRRIRIVAHGQTVIGGVSMRPSGEAEKEFVPPADVVTYSKQPHIQQIVSKVMTPDAVVEFWGCNIGAVPEAGQAWSNLFQSQFKATGDTFKTGFEQFYRRPDGDETGEAVDGLDGLVVQVTHSSQVKSRGVALQKSFNHWLLNRYNEFVKNGDVLPIKGQAEQIAHLEYLFDRSNGDLRFIQIERKDDTKLIRPGDTKEWKKLWMEFTPVKIGAAP